MRDPTDLPSKCDGYGATLTMQHALDCKVGGLVILRHNEIRDCIGDIAAQVWTQVVSSLVLRPTIHSSGCITSPLREEKCSGDVIHSLLWIVGLGMRLGCQRTDYQWFRYTIRWFRTAAWSGGHSGLRLDLGVHGVWQPQVEALFDIKVIDTDAPSYSNLSPESVLESGLKKKDIHTVEYRRGTFTPLVTSVDGLLHREAEHFLKTIATCITSKWQKPYAQTCGYIRARLSFAIVRAASRPGWNGGVAWVLRMGLLFMRSWNETVIYLFDWFYLFWFVLCFWHLFH